MRWWMWIVSFLLCSIHVSAWADAISINSTDELRRAIKASPEYDRVKGIDRLRIAVLDHSFGGYKPGHDMLPESTVIIDQEDYVNFVRERGKEYAEKYQLYWGPEEDPAPAQADANPLAPDQNPMPRKRLVNPLPGKPQEGVGEGDIGHGLQMAHITWATIGKRHASGNPQFYLMNTLGDTNWRRAMRYMIEVVKPDIILHAHVFECCENFDGITGYVDQFVAMVTAEAQYTKKFIWINGVGNFGGRTINAPIRVDRQSQYVLFGEGKDQKDYIEVDSSSVGQNNFRINLNYNSGNTKLAMGTDRNLDLELYDYREHRVGEPVTPNGKNIGLVSGGNLRQVIHTPAYDKLTSMPQGETFAALENMYVSLLDKNEPVDGKRYRLRVKVTSGTFNPDVDKLRLYLTPGKGQTYDSSGKLVDSVAFVFKGERGSSVPSPASSPSVIAVKGEAADASFGFIGRRYKPDVTLPFGFVSFEDGTASTSSSNAAAIFAGMVALMKAEDPDLDMKGILELMNRPQLKLNEQVEKYETVYYQSAARHSPEIVGKIYDAVGTDFVAYQKNGGRLVLEVGDFNRAVQALFPRFRFDRASIEDHEFYLTMRDLNREREERQRQQQYTQQAQYQGQQQQYNQQGQQQQFGQQQQQYSQQGFGNQEPSSIVRVATINGTTRAYYPWEREAYGGKETDFVEIRQKGTPIDRNPKETRIVEGETVTRPIFTLPSIAELKARSK